MTTLPYTLDPEEMAMARAPTELAAWVTERCERMGESPEAKSYGCSGEIWPKKFFEEVRPLSIYALEKYGNEDGVTVQPNLGNENYDGILRLSDGRNVLVEITSAKDGYSDSLRMEVLEAEGHVNALGPIRVSGRRNSPDREVDVSNDAVNHNKLVGEHMALVAERICAKAKPKYSSEHVLIVTVDDYIPFRPGPDIKRLEGFVRALVKSLPLEFSHVAIVGESGRMLFDIGVRDKAPENAL